MTRRLILTYLLVTALVLALLEIPFGLTFQSREENRFISRTERDADVISSSVQESLRDSTPDLPTKVALAYKSQIAGGRVIITDAKGLVVVDSDGTEKLGTDYTNRPEIALALKGQIAQGIRRSKTLNANLIYVAVPAVSNNTVVGTVRITYPASELNSKVLRNWLQLGGIAVLVLMIVSIIGWWFSRGVTQPVAKLRSAAGKLAAGDLTARADTTYGPPEIRALAEDFDQMAERLTDLIQAQRTFVADASHQLRTPLTALRLRLENLEDATDPEMAADIEAAISETLRLQRLVDGLLRLARLDTAKQNVVTVDIAEIAKGRCSMWAPLAEDRNIDLVYYGPGFAFAKAVPGALEQALDNLIGNAFDASPDNTAVTIAVANWPDSVVVQVDDEGPGMTDEQLARARDRFWRSSTSKPGGSGLGLAIVDELARQSGGKFTLERNGANGLRAAIRLQPSNEPPTDL